MDRLRLFLQVRYLLGMLLFASVSVQADAIDLIEIYHLAQSNDPTFEAARYALEAAQQKIPQARAGLLPLVSANGNDNSTRAASQFTGIPIVNRDVHAWTWTLQLTQPLIRVQNVFAYSQSLSQVDEATAQYARVEQDMILRVTQAYFDVLVAEESIAVSDAQLRAAEQQLELATRGFSAGANAVTDMHEAKARVGLARSQRVAASNELEIKRSELEKIVGQLPGALVALQPAVVVPKPQPDDPHAWIDQAREKNPAVLAPKAALAAAEDEVWKNRAGHLPTLDLVASYGKNFSSGSLTTPADFATRSNSSMAGLQLTVPFFAGGSVNSHVSEAIANKFKAADELEVARRQAGTDARQAYSAIMNGLAQIDALESAVESSQSAVKGNQVGYRLGIHMNIDVLNAEQQLYTARRDLVKARYDTLFQGLKLKAAAGVLTESDLASINSMLVR